MRSVAAIALAFVATAELVGWATGNRTLIGLFPSLVPMHPATVVLFGLAAGSVWFCEPKKSSWRRKVGLACTATVIFVATIRLVDHWLKLRSAIDTFLFPAMVAKVAAVVAPTPFQMSVKTSFSFVMIGAALLLMHLRFRFRFPAFLLAIATILISLETITGDLFLDAASQYQTTVNSPMAISTALGFLVLAGVVCVELANGPCERSDNPSPRRSQENLIATGFAAAVIAVCVVGIFARQAIEQFILDVHWDSQTYQVVAAISELAEGLKDAESAGRGYVVSGNELYLETRAEDLKHIDRALVSLRSLTLEDASQKKLLDQLEPVVRVKIAHGSELIRLRRDEGFESAQQLLMTGRGRVLTQQISRLIQDMRSDEDLLLTTRSIGTETNAHRGNLLISTGTAISLILVSLAAWVLYRDSDVRQRAAEVLQADVTARKLQEKELSDLTTTLLVRTCKLEAADEELRQTVERFRSLVESAKEYAIYMLDHDGVIRTWNAGAQRIKGYKAEEIIGKHFSCFYSDEDRANGVPEQELAVALREGQFEEDGWRFRADGSRFWASVVITPLRNDQNRVIGFSKITQDLTERVRAQEQANNFFMLSIELLCIAGKDGYFKRLNKSWETTLGCTTAEMLAVPYLDFVHPEDRRPAVFTVEKTGPFETRYRCKDGSYRWLLWNSAFSRDSELIYAAATDITDRKRVEDEVLALNQALQRQNLKLETTNRELEAFSYSVSHDLRSPLRTIDGFSQAILEDYSDKLDDEGRDHLQRVRGASQRMGQLIDDLLNLSRVTRGSMHQEMTDLSKIAREVADECLATCNDREVKIAIAADLNAQADPRLMRIVFTNLIGNACKFTMKTPQAIIEIGQTDESGQSEFYVRDNGAGFDMNYVGKLFGPFQRLHSENDFPGTGIGLATVQRIVHRHGGRVRAQSKSGCGATFYFTL